MKKQSHIEPEKQASENLHEERILTNSKGNPFMVPANYFDELTDAIKSRLTEGKMLQKRPAYKKPLIYSVSTAAAVILFFLVFWIVISHLKKNNESIALTDAEYKEAITEYLEENLDEHTLIQMSSDSVSIFDSRDMPRLPITDDSLMVSFVSQSNFQFDSTVSKNDIIDYLLNENIDPETL